VTDSSGNHINLPDGSPYLSNFEGGNVDLRVPYIGYSGESIDYRAAGVSQYNAAQLHIDKRLNHGFQVGASYTFSHTTDEQSGLGLFYNGDNPDNLRSGYGLADFDRKHVLNFTYSYQLRSFYSDGSLKGDFTNGWSLNGTTILQSGQPFSVIDFTGAVGSVFYSVSDGINNPSCRWLPAARRRAPLPAPPAHGAIPRSRPTALPFRCSIRRLRRRHSANDPYETNFISTGSATSSARLRRGAPTSRWSR